MKSIRIASDLSLPLDVVTQTIGVLAKRRAGKSYLLRRLVEQLFHGLLDDASAGRRTRRARGDRSGMASASEPRGD